MAKRSNLSKRTRFEVFKRDSFACQYCGRTPPAVVLQVDHIVPVAEGGGNDQGNLLTSCQDCNVGKSDRPLTSAPKSLKSQMAEAQARAEQVKSYGDFLLQQRRDEDAAIERIGRYWFDYFTKPGSYVFGPARIVSARKFLKRLTEAEILEAIDLAMAQKMPRNSDYDRAAFQYFCGICWNFIRARERPASDNRASDDNYKPF